MGVQKNATALKCHIFKNIKFDVFKFLQLFSMGWNIVLRDLMWLPHSIEILLIFQYQQILSPVIILKITNKIVLDIRECKTIFWEDIIVFMKKLVSMRREKER